MEGLTHIRFIIEPQEPTDLIRLFVDCEAQSLGLRRNGSKPVMEQLARSDIIEITIGIKAVGDAFVTEEVSLFLELP